MTPAIAVLCAWLLFGGTHLLLSSVFRAGLVRRLGERNFVLFYAAIAALSLTLLAGAIAHYGADGAAGPDLAAATIGWWILAAASSLGAVLVVAGLMNYPRSPMAVFAKMLRSPPQDGRGALRPPAWVEQITRHPFFVGLALLMGAHTLLAGTLAGAVFFAGFMVLALVGLVLQDRKLRARHGDVYADYLRVTSTVPFGGGFRSFAGAVAWPQVAIAIVGAMLVAALHPLWRIGHGAPFAILVALGGLFAVANRLRR